MINIINKIKRSPLRIMPYALCISVTLASCSDWDDHYEGISDSGNGTTLWQQMQAIPELSDFCQVLESTKVVRMHRKTTVSYADLLNEGQSFTVAAPVNGSFNRDSLIELTNTFQGDSLVEKFFVLNHISRSATSLSANYPNMLMLNQKYMNISAADNTISGIDVQQGNIHTHNGVLHITEKPLPYSYNIFESLCDIEDFSGIGEVIKQFNEDYFLADQSASSGIVEGVPVYVDSVIVERNRLLENIGYLYDEDSTYWMVAPTTEEWQRIWNEANQYFVYDNTVLKRDSLQQMWAARLLLRDAVFNANEQGAPQDSLISVPYMSWRKNYQKDRPWLHVFYKPFGQDGILANATPKQCTNGILYEVDKWPFTPQQTYLQELWTEGENTAYILNYNSCSYNEQKTVGANISQDRFLQIVPENKSSNWDMTFRVDNTLSGAYDICVVVLPQKAMLKENTKPCKFRATISYVDENGNTQTFNCNNTQFKSDPNKIDTIVVAENFKFPTCNYDQNAIKVTVKLACYILPRETASHSREMLLDCIYLRPRTSNTEE